MDLEKEEYMTLRLLQGLLSNPASFERFKHSSLDTVKGGDFIGDRQGPDVIDYRAMCDCAIEMASYLLDQFQVELVQVRFLSF